MAARASGPAPDTAITSTPVGTTGVPTVTFSFTSDTAGSSFRCVLDGAPLSTCASPWTSDALADGSHTFVVAAVADGLEDTAPARSVFTVDTTGPSRSVITAALDPFQRHVRFAVAWSATDASSGVATYAVVSRPDAGTGTPSSWNPWVEGAATTAPFLGKPGHTYCFAVTATDGLGNVSQPSDERCTTVPLDDRALAGAGWIRGFGPGSYRGTFLVTDTVGNELTGPRMRARRIALVATACSYCGTVEVRWNHEVLARVDLSSAGFHPGRIFPVANFDAARWGRVHIVVVSDGARVEIDGLGAFAA